MSFIRRVEKQWNKLTLGDLSLFDISFLCGVIATMEHKCYSGNIVSVKQEVLYFCAPELHFFSLINSFLNVGHWWNSILVSYQGISFKHKVFFTDPMSQISCVRLGQSFFKGVLTFFNTCCDMWYGKILSGWRNFPSNLILDSISFTRNMYVRVSTSLSCEFLVRRSCNSRPRFSALYHEVHLAYQKFKTFFWNNQIYRIVANTFFAEPLEKLQI